MGNSGVSPFHLYALYATVWSQVSVPLTQIHLVTGGLFPRPKPPGHIFFENRHPPKTRPKAAENPFEKI